MLIHCAPRSGSAVVTTAPPSATATPKSVTSPCVVPACNSTMALPAATAAEGTVSPVPGMVFGEPCCVFEVAEGIG